VVIFTYIGRAFAARGASDRLTFIPFENRFEKTRTKRRFHLSQQGSRQTNLVRNPALQLSAFFIQLCASPRQVSLSEGGADAAIMTIPFNS
jgi:hypothetical protein